jgi:hypothetical protein
MSVWSILRRVLGRGKALTRVRGGRRDTDTAIATVLVLSPRIVRNHMTSIYQTLCNALPQRVGRASVRPRLDGL